jgi:hypothetical protein
MWPPLINDSDLRFPPMVMPKSSDSKATGPDFDK